MLFVCIAAISQTSPGIQHINITNESVMVDWDPPSNANISQYRYRLLIDGTEKAVVNDSVAEVPFTPAINTSLRIDVFTLNECNQPSDSSASTNITTRVDAAASPTPIEECSCMSVLKIVCSV